MSVATEPGTLRILHGVTAPLTATIFLRGQLRSLVERGHEVHLVCGHAAELADFARAEGVTLHEAHISRNPSPLRDLQSLVSLARVVRRVRPHVVVMGTPKMGLLGTLVSVLCRVPRRIYVLHGLRLEGTSGSGRVVLTALERLTCRAATDIVAVSPSLREKAISLGLTPRRKIRVLGAGSANGVDCERFRPATAEQRDRSRRQLGIADDAVVVTFVGRLHRDKGLDLLDQVWEQLSPRHRQAQLLLVGPDETKSAADAEVLHRLLRREGVLHLPFHDAIERIYWASDVCVLPTRREGMPTVPLEAAACGIPVVATVATGTVDAVEDGVTGRLVPQDDAAAMAGALEGLMASPNRRVEMGQQGRQRVCAKFNGSLVWKAWCEDIDGSAFPTWSRQQLRASESWS